ncbi:hypothetical protein [Deinococcus multiflagellatus]|uniref:PASTA domain-containing protein n=1 Tax=Deinococcus multiflagellatus TaxID=1656887 RepID=A0ABW1ZRF3_9DEIO
MQRIILIAAAALILAALIIAVLSRPTPREPVNVTTCRTFVERLGWRDLKVQGSAFDSKVQVLLIGTPPAGGCRISSAVSVMAS